MNGKLVPLLINTIVVQITTMTRGSGTTAFLNRPDQSKHKISF